MNASVQFRRAKDAAPQPQLQALATPTLVACLTRAARHARRQDEGPLFRLKAPVRAVVFPFVVGATFTLADGASLRVGSTLPWGPAWRLQFWPWGAWRCVTPPQCAPAPARRHAARRRVSGAPRAQTLFEELPH